jgi:hypothetical protein
MNTPQDETTKENANVHTIDITAPAGSENSLGTESVHDGRPATDDSVVEAIDEVGPGVTDVPENTSPDSWKSKGAEEGNATRPNAKHDPHNGSLTGQLGHRDQDEMLKDNDTDFPEPDAQAEHSGSSSQKNG